MTFRSRTGRKGPYAAYYVQIKPGGGSLIGEPSFSHAGLGLLYILCSVFAFLPYSIKLPRRTPPVVSSGHRDTIISGECRISSLHGALLSFSVTTIIHWLFLRFVASNTTFVLPSGCFTAFWMLRRAVCAYGITRMLQGFRKTCCAARGRYRKRAMARGQHSLERNNNFVLGRSAVKVIL